MLLHGMMAQNLLGILSLSAVVSHLLVTARPMSRRCRLAVLFGFRGPSLIILSPRTRYCAPHSESSYDLDARFTF